MNKNTQVFTNQICCISSFTIHKTQDINNRSTGGMKFNIRISVSLSQTK